MWITTKPKKIAQQRAAAAEAREAANKRLSQEKIDAAERKVKELEAALQREKAAASRVSVPGSVTVLTSSYTSPQVPADPFAGEMVRIPAGSIQIGSSKDSDNPVRRVSVQAFELGKYEVTQKEWRDVMGGNPSNFTRCGDNCPVAQVSWDDIQIFLQKLNAKTGRQYRLPNEAEWEYACYGGSTSEYCGSNNITAVAWYDGNSGISTHPVGQKQANGYGLYDMSGNVWEWMSDCYDSSCVGRALRGGSWLDGRKDMRAADRTHFSPSDRFASYGFRLDRTLP